MHINFKKTVIKFMQKGHIIDGKPFYWQTFKIFLSRKIIWKFASKRLSLLCQVAMQETLKEKK